MRAGFVGTGGISGVHLRYLASREDVEVAALCDLDEARVREKQEKSGGRAYSDFRRMLDTEDLDAVWLCTPPQVRGEVLLACAERGVPVFCEKPVERVPERAAETAEALESLGANVQVGYCFRTLPVVRTLREIMRDDTVHLVQSFYGCGISLSRSTRPWFYDKDRSGGALVDQATHNFDLLRYLIGEVDRLKGFAANPVHAKRPGYTVDEAIALCFRFENGVLGSHVHTWVGDGWRNEITLNGERRHYRLNLGTRTLVAEEKGKTREHSSGERALHDYENEVFVEMVETGDWSRNPCTYADGARSLEFTVAADRALEGV